MELVDRRNNMITMGEDVLVQLGHNYQVNLLVDGEEVYPVDEEKDEMLTWGDVLYRHGLYGKRVRDLSKVIKVLEDIYPEYNFRK